MIGGDWTVPIYQKKLNFIYLNPNMMENFFSVNVPLLKG